MAESSAAVHDTLARPRARLDALKPMIDLLRLLGEVAELTKQTFVALFKRPFEGAEFLRQVVQIGLRSTTIVLLTGVFSAMVITVQFALQLARFGAKGWVGSVVGVTLARELGPVMTALMVGGRVGAGIASSATFCSRAWCATRWNRSSCAG